MKSPLRQFTLFGAAFLAATFAAAPASAKLPNSAACIYEGITVEEKEIAIVMLVGEIATGFDGSIGTEPRKEIEFLLEEAHNRCLDLYPWSTGESGNAAMYAMFSLLRDTIGDFPENCGSGPRSSRDIFSGQTVWHLVKPAIRKNLKINAEELRAHLEAAGWPAQPNELHNLATGYVGMSALAEMRHKWLFGAGFIIEADAS